MKIRSSIQVYLVNFSFVGLILILHLQIFCALDEIIDIRCYNFETIALWGNKLYFPIFDGDQLNQISGEFLFLFFFRPTKFIAKLHSLTLGTKTQIATKTKLLKHVVKTSKKSTQNQFSIVYLLNPNRIKTFKIWRW